MIRYPKHWQVVGQPIKTQAIEDTLFDVLREISCPFLSFSGGVDSTLMLYLMLKVYPVVDTFTIGLSEEHPDIYYANKVALLFPNVHHHIYLPKGDEIEKEKRGEDYPGDDAVRLFYKFISKHTDKIIACDGIDEYMCGYFRHQENPTEDTYYDILLELRDKQLIPLNEGSGNANVYLPYLDERIVTLLSQIPVFRKVDEHSRKKVLMELAQKYIPEFVIERRKYGFCDAVSIKD